MDESKEFLYDLEYMIDRGYDMINDIHLTNDYDFLARERDPLFYS